MASLVFKPLFSVFHAPRTSLPRVTVEQLRPSSKSVFLFLFVSYAIILSGIIYDAINEPPAIGQGVNPRTGMFSLREHCRPGVGVQLVGEAGSSSPSCSSSSSRAPSSPASCCPRVAQASSRRR